MSNILSTVAIVRIAFAMIIRNSFFLTGMALVAGACSPNPPLSSRHTSVEERALKKINLDVDEIDDNGLIGPSDGKRSVAYEFCIPLEEAKRKEVSVIDPSVHFLTGSKGRIGCQPGQYLCIGEGGTRDVLLKLASLNYIKQIDPFYGE